MTWQLLFDDMLKSTSERDAIHATVSMLICTGADMCKFHPASAAGHLTKAVTKFTTEDVLLNITRLLGSVAAQSAKAFADFIASYAQRLRDLLTIFTSVELRVLNLSCTSGRHIH